MALTIYCMKREKNHEGKNFNSFNKTWVMSSTASWLKLEGRFSCPFAIFANVSSSLSLHDPNGISPCSMK